MSHRHPFSALYPPPLLFSQQARINSLEHYGRLQAEARQNPDQFWIQLAAEQLSWHRPPAQALDESNPPFYRWFADGQLNVSYNCLEVNIENGNADKVAIIFEYDDGQNLRFTYRDLLRKVSQFANGLKALGYERGERAIIYMPSGVEGIVAMQACARLGIVHSVVFGGFTAQALRDRINDIEASFVITADQGIRGGKTIALKETVDAALADGVCPTVKEVIVYQRTGEPISWDPRVNRWFQEVTAGQPDYCAPTWMDAEDTLFVLYTSGSTGKPKGIQHTQAGYLLWAKLTCLWVFDAKPDDVFWCTADIGWITGHTYMAYGPLAAGLTQVVFEGTPAYPNAGRFWEMIQKHCVTIFYTAPTAIRSLIKASSLEPQFAPGNYDLNSLRLLGTVGEPINPEVWRWYYAQVGRGRCPIVDTWWQTETGGHLLAPLPGAISLKPGSATLPMVGIEAAVVDETGQEMPVNEAGKLVIMRPWPGMLRNIWRDPERFKQTYFPDGLRGFYLTGDGARRDEDGYIWITGRIDDVLNVSGHRLSTAEIESALVAHELVAEAAVVSRLDENTGEAVVAFVTLKEAKPTGQATEEVAASLREWVREQIGSLAKPSDIIFTDGLPKTRSGKTMRRLLRALARREEINQDLSTLENPGILDDIANSR